MDVAPPPPPGSRIQDLGDRLIVRFQPRRSWGEIAFLTFWLTFWTFGGIAALLALPREGWGGRAFVLAWLCVWVIGECIVIVTIAWQLFGSELLAVTPQYLEVRQEIGRFARTKRYAVGLVHDVGAARVPSDEDEPPRKDFCLEVSYDEKAVRIGEGMDEREAEYVASTVLSRIRPRARWSDQESATLRRRLLEPTRVCVGDDDLRALFRQDEGLAAASLRRPRLVDAMGMHRHRAGHDRPVRGPHLGLPVLCRRHRTSGRRNHLRPQISGADPRRGRRMTGTAAA